jgi:hypothetical protein
VDEDEDEDEDLDADAVRPCGVPAVGECDGSRLGAAEVRP